MSSNPAVTIGVSAVDNAKAVLDSVDAKVQATANKVIQSNDQMATKSSSAMALIKANYMQIGTAAAGLASGITGFATSFDVLEKAELAVDKQALALARSQEILNDKIKSGKATSQELANAQEAVRQNTEKLALAQDAMHDTYTNFLANIPSQMFGFASGAIGIFNMLKIQQTTTAASSVAMSAIYSGALTGMNAANAATTVSTMTLSSALKAAFISNPIGLIIMGVSTAAVLLATNFDKISGAVQYAGKIIFEFLEAYFKPLADAIRWLIDGFNSLGAGLSTDVAPSLVETSSATLDLANSTTETGKAVEKTIQELETYQDYIVRTGQDTIETTNENYNFIQSLGKLDSVLGKTSDQVDLAADYLRDLEREKQRQIEANFKLVADETSLQKALAMTNEELAKQADAYRKLSEDKTGKKPAEDSFSSEPFSTAMHYSSVAKYGSVEKYLEHKENRAFDMANERLQKVKRRDLYASASAEDIKQYVSGGNQDLNVTINDYGAYYDVELAVGNKRKSIRRSRTQTPLSTAQ